ncbi:MAG: Phosphate regulon sensor protein PhoR [Steroidobacteraceae bacterium]|nr:Phosphate regulon sensor protein PhoR [Steroidobacteraceae bacterium]
MLGVALAIGLISGQVPIALLLAVLACVAWQFSKLLRFDYWLRHRSRSGPPALGGAWDDVVAQVLRIHRRKRYHKERFVTLARELRDATAALPDGVVLLDARGGITWFNRMAQQLLGLRGRQDVGVRIDNLLRRPEFGAYLAGGDHSRPLLLRTGEATEAWLSLHVLPYGEGQRLLLLRDVTRETRIETMRKDFVANASHELRSPLTVITGYLETIADDIALDPALAPPLAEMRRQAERMAAIIGDLLVLSRLEAKEEQVDGRPIDVAAMLAQLRNEVLARPQHPAEVSLMVDPNDRLLGDELEIHSAFANLVDNAAKYTPASGRIALRWWVDRDGGHCSVTDTGPGIPAAAIPRLTERFYRVDAGRSRATGGSGLGLAIVKHVLQRHGATLEIASVEDRGSTFTCHFPAHRVVAAAGNG